MKKYSKILLPILFLAFSSCVDTSGNRREECINRYLEADEELTNKLRVINYGPEQVETLYNNYLKKYEEINKDCEKYKKSPVNI